MVVHWDTSVFPSRLSYAPPSATTALEPGSMARIVENLMSPFVDFMHIHPPIASTITNTTAIIMITVIFVPSELGSFDVGGADGGAIHTESVNTSWVPHEMLKPSVATSICANDVKLTMQFLRYWRSCSVPVKLTVTSLRSPPVAQSVDTGDEYGDEYDDE